MKITLRFGIFGLMFLALLGICSLVGPASRPQHRQKHPAVNPIELWVATRLANYGHWNSYTSGVYLRNWLHIAEERSQRNPKQFSVTWSPPAE
jgi:hypothetical protein